MNGANNIPRTKIARDSRDSAAAVRARKVTILAQLASLKAQVESNVGEDWETCGSLGYIEEQLANLLGNR